MGGDSAASVNMISTVVISVVEHLLQDVPERPAFYQEAVMTVFGLYLGIHRPVDMLRHEFLLLYREKVVAVYPDYHRIRLDTFQRSLYSAPASAYIVAVQRICQTIVGICVEPVYQLLALILLV